MEVREELLTERKKNETNYEQEIQEIVRKHSAL